MGNFDKVGKAELVQSELKTLEGVRESRGKREQWEYGVNRLTFDVAEIHGKPRDNSNTMQLVARVFYRRLHRHDPAPAWHHQVYHLLRKPYYVYLCGGPGSGNGHSKCTIFIDRIIGNGFQVMFLDYRGTGDSSKVTNSTLKKKGDAEHQAAYLRRLLQLDIARDLEAIRLCLGELVPTWNGEVKWILQGQSYGGWIALTYLSFCDKALHRVHLTGALPPINHSPDEVYEQTYTIIVQKNVEYYKTYPCDAQRVRDLARYLLENGGRAGIRLPAGGLFTLQQLLCLGRGFSSERGMRSVHELIEKMAKIFLGQESAENVVVAEREILEAVERAGMGFDRRPMYALLQEAIYCDKPGQVADWAAFRVGRKYSLETFIREIKRLGDQRSVGDIEEDVRHFNARPFYWLDGDFKDGIDPGKTLCFAGEMVYPFHYDNYSGLRNMVGVDGGQENELRRIADEIMEFSGWDNLYDLARLRNTSVPVCAVTYKTDFCVSYKFAEETARTINPEAMRHFVSDDWPHTAFKDENHVEKVLEKFRELAGREVVAQDYLSG